MFEYKYARPALTSDCVVFGLDERNLKVLLIQRDRYPFEGCWALPGGFVNVGESVEKAALRELKEETGLDNVFLEQLSTFGDPGRDPREHIVTIVYYALVNVIEHDVQAATDARNAAWFNPDDMPELAFDHDKILDTACEKLKWKIRYQPMGFELLPETFPLKMLQSMYEKILNKKLNKKNFRKKILKTGILNELDASETDVSQRTPKLYQFDKKKYDQMVKKGFHFEI